MPKQNMKKRRTSQKAGGQGQGTFISYRRGPKQPAPISNSRAIIRRTIAVTKATAGDLTIGDISSGLGAGGDFAILAITGFSVPSDAAGIFQTASFTVKGSNIMSTSSSASSPALDDTVVQDSGTADSRASVRFNVPAQRSSIFNCDTGSTVAAANCSTPCLWHVLVMQYVV